MVLLVISGICCFAQTAELVVPKAGSYLYWFTFTNIDGKPDLTTPYPFKDKKVTVDLPMVMDAPAKSTLYVLNTATGNEAIISVNAKSAASSKIKLEESNFDYLRRVEISVISEARQRPVASGIVKLEVEDKPVRVQVLDPSANGLAYFSDVPAGSAKLSIEYGDGKSSSHDIDLNLERESPLYSLKVPVVGDVEVVEADSQSGGHDKGSVKGGNSGRTYSFVALFGGIFLFSILMAGSYFFLNKRGVKVVDELKKLGVDVPQDEKPKDTEPVTHTESTDTGLCPFCGTSVDPVTGHCACSMGSDGVSPTPSTSSAKLIATQGAYAGTVFMLDKESTSIGRAETNDIALPEDSTASREHAVVSTWAGEFVVRDVGSSNGTFVNGMKASEQIIHSGDEIQVGSTHFRLEV